jgi:hypothetical protein
MRRAPSLDRARVSVAGWLTGEGHACYVLIALLYGFFIWQYSCCDGAKETDTREAFAPCSPRAVLVRSLWIYGDVLAELAASGLELGG